MVGIKTVNAQSYSEQHPSDVETVLNVCSCINWSVGIKVAGIVVSEIKLAISVVVYIIIKEVSERRSLRQFVSVVIITPGVHNSVASVNQLIGAKHIQRKKFRINVVQVDIFKAVYRNTQFFSQLDIEVGLILLVVSAIVKDRIKLTHFTLKLGVMNGISVYQIIWIGDVQVVQMKVGGLSGQAPKAVRRNRIVALYPLLIFKSKFNGVFVYFVFRTFLQVNGSIKTATKLRIVRVVIIGIRNTRIVPHRVGIE